jgi:hypothetical protein
MLIETGKGFDTPLLISISGQKIVGFKSTSIIPLAGASSAVIAYK